MLIKGVCRSRLLPFATVCVVAGCSAESGAETSSVPSATDVWQEGPALLRAVTNNAVAAVTIDGRTSVFSFLGVDSTKAWSGVTSSVQRWDVGTGRWRESPPVPGPGRLAATAVPRGDRIYVIGGYTVAEDGAERSLPDVAIFDPEAETWSRGSDIPVPTDDAVAGVSADGLIYLVSGWHDSGNVADVQVYDPDEDRWSAASSIVGAPVFGHTGGIAGDRIAYLGGAAVVDARPRFRIDSTSWVGTIEPDGPGAISWAPTSSRPGPPLYRAAGGVVGDLVVFVGGTDNPYNYDGVGYDGVPARPIRQILTYAPGADRWGTLAPLPVATMDHRNAAVSAGRVFIVGGMLENQIVSDRVWWANAAELLATAGPAHQTDAR